MAARKQLKKKGKAMNDLPPEDVMVEEDTKDLADEIDQPVPEVGATPEAEETVEPYGAQVLRRLHEDHMGLMRDYDEMMELLENEDVKDHLKVQLEHAEEVLTKTEEMFQDHYSELAGLDGVPDEESGDTETKDLDEDEIEEKDTSDGDDDSVPADSTEEELPSPDEVAEGMSTKDFDEDDLEEKQLARKSFRSKYGKLAPTKSLRNSKAKAWHKGQEDEDEKEEKRMGTKALRAEDLKPGDRIKYNAPSGPRVGTVTEVPWPNYGSVLVRFDDGTEGSLSISTDVTRLKSLRQRKGFPTDTTMKIEKVSLPHEKAMDDDDKEKVDEAVKFLKDLSEETEFDEEKRMKSYHYHKALDDIAGDEEEETKNCHKSRGRYGKKGETDWCMTCDGYGALDEQGNWDPDGKVPCPDCGGSGFSKRMKSIPGDAEWAEEEAGEDEHKGAIGGAVGAGIGAAVGGPVGAAAGAGIGNAITGSLKSLRKSLRKAARFFKALAYEKAFGDAHRAKALMHWKELDPMVEELEGEAKFEPEGEELLGPGGTGEKGLVTCPECRGTGEFPREGTNPDVVRGECDFCSGTGEVEEDDEFKSFRNRRTKDFDEMDEQEAEGGNKGIRKGVKHWAVHTRANGYRILEGAGTDGGAWMVKWSDQTTEGPFRSIEEVKEHIAMSGFEVKGIRRKTKDADEEEDEPEEKSIVKSKRMAPKGKAMRAINGPYMGALEVGDDVYVGDSQSGRIGKVVQLLEDDNGGLYYKLDNGQTYPENKVEPVEGKSLPSRRTKSRPTINAKALKQTLLEQNYEMEKLTKRLANLRIN